MELEDKILDLLEEDASVSPEEISVMLGESEKKVTASIEKLRKDGVIKKTSTVVDWKKAGRRHARALIQVKVVPQVKAGFAKTCEDIAADSRVKDVYVVTGEYDLIVSLRAESLEDISDFVTERLAPKKEVVGTNTNVILNEFKRAGVLLFDRNQSRLKVSI